MPKPLPRPRPPLWLACSRRETILLAAKLGLGALTFAFVSPEESRQWVHDYYQTIENECDPIGHNVNPAIAIACPFLCDRDEKRVREMSDEHHGFFMYGLGHYAFFGNHEPGQTNLRNNYKSQPAKVTVDDPLASAAQSQTCVGTPGQVRAALHSFEDSGLDQVIFLSQAGSIPSEMLASSIELFGKEVLPEVTERDQKRASEKAALRDRIINKAMARKRAPQVPNWGKTVVRAAGHH